MTARTVRLASFAAVTAPGAAYAFQSRTLECGLTYVVPSLLLAAVTAIVAVVRTVMVLRAEPPRSPPLRLWPWWLVPALSTAVAVVASFLC